MERIFEIVGAILDFADDRSRAWIVAAGAALVIVASWLIALSRFTRQLAADAAANGSLTNEDRLLTMAAVFAPFVLVNAVWQAVEPKDVGAESYDGGPLAGWSARDAIDKRRRRLLASAFAGALNAFSMSVATH